MRDFLKEIEQALKMYINLHSFARKELQNEYSMMKAIRLLEAFG